VLLFGGNDDAVIYQDTWEWDGTAWTEVTPAGTSPTPRGNAKLAYDVSRSRAVLFGGSSDDDSIWEWDGVARTWSQRTATGPRPGARWDHALAYDSLRKVVVLFFGALAGADYKSNIWEWDGAAGTWAERIPTSGAPSGRNCPAMAYDEKAARTVLVGGLSGIGRTMDEVWEWDGDSSTWTNLGSAAPMPSRNYHAMAFDAARGKAMVFGGLNKSMPEPAGSTVLGDLWER
jgi:hypothetical protein